MNDNASHSSCPADDADADRIPLVRLAGQGVPSQALLRVVRKTETGRGPGRVAVAAFQSSV